MARIKSWGKRKGAGQLQCPGRWHHGRSRAELAGVRHLSDPGHRKTKEKHQREEGEKANSPRDVLGSEINRIRRAACSGGRELPCEFRRPLEQCREGEKERWSLGEPRNLDEKLGRVLISRKPQRTRPSTAAVNPDSRRSNPRRLWRLERLRAS